MLAISLVNLKTNNQVDDQTDISCSHLLAGKSQDIVCKFREIAIKPKVPLYDPKTKQRCWVQGISGGILHLSEHLEIADNSQCVNYL